MKYTLKQLSELFNADIIGDENYIVDKVSSIENATSTSLVFVSDKKFLKSLDKTNSKVVITTKPLSKFCSLNVIVSKNPYLLFSKVSQLINKKNNLVYGIHDSVVNSTSNLNKKIIFEPNVVIGKKVQLGDNVFIGANCYIGDYVDIGENSYINPNVTIYNNVKIESNLDFAIDSYEDFILANKIIHKMKNNHSEYNYLDILQFQFFHGVYLHVHPYMVHKYKY